MYIQYTMAQLYLPMDLEEEIPSHHLVRVVNTAVNRLDDAFFAAAYPGGGRDSYHKEKSKAWKSQDGKIENWNYDEEQDTWTCKAGRTLHFRYESKERTESGYEIRKRHYRSASCEDCPLKSSCTKVTGNREVTVSMEALRYRN
ncbi:hypothetical protein J2T20_001199 [Paenibacillus wynnii]|nr:hypothetical protein [Paenibacillus wynnii]